MPKGSPRNNPARSSAVHLGVLALERPSCYRASPKSEAPEPAPPEPEDAERSRFARFAKKLVSVPKKEIDEKAEEWKRDRGRKDD